MTMLNDKWVAVLLICAGASLGALMRYAIYLWIGRHFDETFFATMIVNMVGSLLIGVAFVFFLEIDSPRLQLLLMTGLLASLTTFSTLSLDALKFFSQGQVGLALAYVFSQVIFGISFCYFGVRIGQKFIET